MRNVLITINWIKNLIYARIELDKDIYDEIWEENIASKWMTCEKLDIILNINTYYSILKKIWPENLANILMNKEKIKCIKELLWTNYWDISWITYWMITSIWMKYFTIIDIIKLKIIWTNLINYKVKAIWWDNLFFLFFSWHLN